LSGKARKGRSEKAVKALSLAAESSARLVLAIDVGERLAGRLKASESKQLNWASLSDRRRSTHGASSSRPAHGLFWKARLIVETVLADDLLDAVLDGLPRSLKNPASEKRERKWEIALASRNFDQRPTL
jgi:hypothetical protein